MRSLTAVVKENEMLPYQEYDKLEKLLESLYGNNDELGLEDIVVVNEPFVFGLLSTCCSYSYTCYN